MHIRLLLGASDEQSGLTDRPTSSKEKTTN